MTHLEIYRYLAKTNCGRCQLPSCLAFAAAVRAGQKKLSDCPLLDQNTQQELRGRLTGQPEQELYQFVSYLEELEQRIQGLDLAQLAPRLGGRFQEDAAGGRLCLQSLGKEFQIDRQGEVHSECHRIPWVQAPLLAYTVNPQHQEITGHWLNFRDLPGGMERRNLFTSRCEAPLNALANQNPELLHDLAELFLGQPASGFTADLALILHPLPHFPLLLCWQAPEEELASSLTLLFDACCAVNLPSQATFSLCIGLVQMFMQIARIHR
jgi:hypothetical protein